MKRILFVNFSLDIGGIETLILEICRGIDRSKYAPAVCSFFENGRLAPEFLAIDVPVHTVPKKRPGLDPTMPFRLAAFMREKGIDIAHTHNPSIWLYGGLAAKMAGASLVHTEHSQSDYNTARWAVIERGLSLFTDRVTAVSKAVRDTLVNVEKVADRKVTVIHNGIKSGVFDLSVDAAAKRRELGVGEKDFVFVMVARFDHRKDHGVMLRAFAAVKKASPQARLILVGEGGLRAPMETLSRELGIANEVRFLGNRRDVPEILKAADAFVLSSKSEGFPVVILEAMAAGLPVAATNAGGNAEAVSEGETGFIVPIQDPEALAAAMLKLSTDPARARALGENGKVRVKAHFTFEKMIRAYYDIYDSISARRSGMGAAQ